MVIAVEMGNFCKVKKKIESAVTPNTPRKIKNVLALPNGEIFNFHTTTKLNTNEMILLNRISSVTGKPDRSLTHTCINENANDEMSMYFTALFTIFSKWPQS